MLLLTETKRTRSAVQESQTAEAERRGGLRVRQNRPIKVYEPTSGKYLGGQTEDVSSSGLRITLPVSSPLTTGRLLSIHVGLSALGNALANRRQMMPARVVWVNRPANAAQGTLSAGIEFLASIAARLDAA